MKKISDSYQVLNHSKWTLEPKKSTALFSKILKQTITHRLPMFFALLLYLQNMVKEWGKYWKVFNNKYMFNDGQFYLSRKWHKFMRHVLYIRNVLLIMHVIYAVGFFMLLQEGLKMLLQENFTTFICSMLKYLLHKLPIQPIGAKKTMYISMPFLSQCWCLYSVD